MIKSIIIVLLLVIIGTDNLKSQTPIDTLQWLKTNIEQKNYLFSGKPLSVLFDSLGNLKNALADYDAPIIDDNGQFSDTTHNAFLRIYFAPGSLFVFNKYHRHSYSPVTHRDTLNTHVPCLEITFASPVPFVTAWFDNDKERLGSMKWNRYLRNYWGQFIVDSVIVGEY
ncbi:MAG: hypothetical protein KF781_07025 [Chitinophagaceae bacterium]|nr:hypothetical protein [Chitinophagaceae bacterium]MCW5904026.1 hypothetical protein [Chitinophagaceae bacterium]